MKTLLFVGLLAVLSLTGCGKKEIQWNEDAVVILAINPEGSSFIKKSEDGGVDVFDLDGVVKAAAKLGVDVEIVFAAQNPASGIVAVLVILPVGVDGPQAAETLRHLQGVTSTTYITREALEKMQGQMRQEQPEVKTEKA